MKSFKPKEYDTIYSIVPRNTHDLFIDLKLLEDCLQASEAKWGIQGYEGLMRGLGKTVFVFDIDSCEFFEEEGGDNA